MSENRNIFLEYKKTILQITKVNDAIDTGVGAAMAVAFARDVLAGRQVQGITAGVDNFASWVGEIDNLTDAEISAQQAEFNRQATEAIQRGEPWHL